MKHVSLALAVFGLAGLAMAQTRIISHVTRAGGGFETSVLIENRAATAVEYVLTAYDAAGAALTPARGVIEGETAEAFTVADLFAGDGEVSHFTIEGGDLFVTAAYRALGQGNSPAHTPESADQSAHFRLYAGDWGTVFDGFAAVNMGAVAAEVRVDQKTLDGRLVRSVAVASGLAPMAKTLYVVGGPAGSEFEPRDDVYYEIVASHRLAVTALRGTQPEARFLWVNPAQPFVPAIGNMINDRPGGQGGCVDPFSLGDSVDDVNNMPQAEVMIDVSEDGRLAGAAKDYRYSPLDDVTYNLRVWCGLYLSDDQGGTWRNTTFDGGNPNQPVTGQTPGHFGQPAGVDIVFRQESDPVVAFDRDGNLYTTALAFSPPTQSGGPFPAPSAITVARWDKDGQFVPGTLHFLGAENDSLLFNDKNWIAVDRTAPVESTVVVIAWRLFTSGTSADPAPSGGYVAVSADGSDTFSQPVRVPVPLAVSAAGQFFQPVIGPDPVTGSKTLYVLFRNVNPSDFSIQMHMVKSDIGSLPAGDTQALWRHLNEPVNWTYLPNRLPQLFSYGSGGSNGSAFRFTSYFMPSLDRDTGWLYAVVAAFEPTTMGSRVVITRSTDGGATWSAPKDIDYPGSGHQIQPVVAARNGVVSVVWLDSRADENFTPFSPIPLIDVYYAELDLDLNLTRLERMTKQSQRTDHQVFTLNVGGNKRALDPHVVYPHDLDFYALALSSLGFPAKPDHSGRAGKMEPCGEYGFIGDYIGLAADDDHAYLAWCDFRDVNYEETVCAGHSCNGRRNLNVYYARIRKGAP